MPARPTFSFIIPSRNEGHLLVETVTHLQQQYHNSCCEVIIIDDGSTAPELSDFNGSIPLTIHRSEHRLGVARARNLGASMARGSVLIFTDAHVCFSGNLFEELDASGVMSNEGIRGCGTRLLNNLEVFLQMARGETLSCLSSFQTYFGWKLIMDPLPDVVVIQEPSEVEPFCVPYVGACALAISQQLFWVLGGFDEGLTGFGSLEDAELAMRCWGAGRDVKVISSVFCNHYCRPLDIDTGSLPREEKKLDHPRYEGSFANSLRVMALHFPEQLFADILIRLRTVHPDCQEVLQRIDFASPEMIARRNWIDQRRFRDRDWLIRRMTRV